MSDSSKFWLSINVIWGFVVLGAVYLGSTHYQSVNDSINELVKNGASPIEAMCAVQDDFGNNPSCIAIVAKK